MSQLPNPAEVADRDARRLALVLQEVGGAGEPVGSGWMACDHPGSWAHYAAGLGTAGPVDDADLDRLVAFYASRDREPRIQTTPYQHPSLLAGLGARGFVPYEQDTVLVRPLQGLPIGPDVPGLEFRSVEPSDDASVTAFVDSQLRGFFAPDEAPEGIRPIMARVARNPRCRTHLLVLDGEVVGCGGLETFEDSAVLIAGCVYPQARRRGVQSAYIRFRLQRAAALGFRYAVVGSTPGQATERNALRAGFRVAYTQTGLRRPSASPEP